MEKIETSEGKEAIDETMKLDVKKIRNNVIKTLKNSGGGHYGSSLSCVEIITALYSSVLVETEGQDFRFENWGYIPLTKNKFILSKAHASLALFAVLSERGIIDEVILKTYGKTKSCLGIHAERDVVPMVEFSCGSLGHGLPYAVGLALAYKMKSKDNKVFVLLGDGECQEGSVWEAIRFASEQNLDNLIVIIDYNKFSISANTYDELFEAKWLSFGCETIWVDGHNMKELKTALYWRGAHANVIVDKKPLVIIAETIKGKGLKKLEGKKESHFYKGEI